MGSLNFPFFIMFYDVKNFPFLLDADINGFPFITDTDIVLIKNGNVEIRLDASLNSEVCMFKLWETSLNKKLVALNFTTSYSKPVYFYNV